MSEHGSGGDRSIDGWHRSFAGESFNRTWVLLEMESRSEDEDLEMLASALASLHHWRRVGEARNLSISDWQVSRVLAVLEYPTAASRFARRSLRIAEESDLGPFYEGYAHEALARAAALVGDIETRDAHLSTARALADRVDPADDAEPLRKDLDEVAALGS